MKLRHILTLTLSLALQTALRAAPAITVAPDGSPNLIDGVGTVDFSSVNVGSTSQKTFVITNSGDEALVLDTITKSDPNAVDFTVGEPESGTIAAGTSTTFTITFSPTLGGAQSATIQIPSNVVGATNPFDLTVTGSGYSNGSLSFGSDIFEVNSSSTTTTTVNIVINRSIGSDGAVGATLSTVNGTATSPGQYTAITGVANVSFADAVSAPVNFPIKIAQNATTTSVSAFQVALSAPSGGASLGTPAAATVYILPPVAVVAADSVKPSLTITTPANRVNLNEGTSVVISGTAKDNLGIKRVQISFDNGATFANATLAGPGSRNTTYSYTLPTPPADGVNTFIVKATDFNGQSTSVTRTFTQLRKLAVTIDSPEDGAGTITAGFAPESNRLVGASLTLTAIPKKGFIFVGWVDETTTFLTDSPTLTFTMEPEKTLTAVFDYTPYESDITGAYNGLVLTASGLSFDGNDSVGRLQDVIVGNTGAFSGRLLIDGSVFSVRGTFNFEGDARFGKDRSPRLVLKRPGKPSLQLEMAIDLELDPGDFPIIEGVLFQEMRGIPLVFSRIFADRAGYSTKTPVPEALAGKKSKPYTLIFPAIEELDQPTEIEKDYFPQGTGFATMSVSANGTARLAGKLADNTPFTSSAPLSADNYWPIYASLYRAKGCFAGWAKLEDAPDNLPDVSGSEFTWIRPYQDSQWYPDGWSDSLLVDITGARYVVPPALPAASVFPLISGTDADGNANLIFSDGLLTSSPLNHDINMTSTNLASPVAGKVPTLKITKANGYFNGLFTHSDGTQPSYQGVILQKGDKKGGHGYFMTSRPKIINGLGAGGKVEVLAK